MPLRKLWFLIFPTWLSYLLCKQFMFNSNLPKDNCEIVELFIDDEHIWFIGKYKKGDIK